MEDRLKPPPDHRLHSTHTIQSHYSRLLLTCQGRARYAPPPPQVQALAFQDANISGLQSCLAVVGAFVDSPDVDPNTLLGDMTGVAVVVDALQGSLSALGLGLSVFGNTTLPALQAATAVALGAGDLIAEVQAGSAALAGALAALPTAE